MLRDGKDAVLACSALKRRYRRFLADGSRSVSFVYLRVPADRAEARLMRRPHHFMPADLVATQFAALEAPSADEALIVDATRPVEAIVETICGALQLGCPGSPVHSRR